MSETSVIHSAPDEAAVASEQLELSITDALHAAFELDEQAKVLEWDAFNRVDFDRYGRLLGRVLVVSCILQLPGKKWTGAE